MLVSTKLGEAHIMATGSAEAQSLIGPKDALVEMPTPANSVATPSVAPPPINPQGRVRLYDAGEWEEFIREWATALPDRYVQIKRFGGSGDHGADIAAFKSDHGFEGSWDCFQAKHYSATLSFSDAGPEILKIFSGVLDGHYTLPDTYSFLAPLGCGTQLNQLLSNPTRLKERFLTDLQSPKRSLGKDLKSERMTAVLLLAQQVDFALFRSVEVIDALTQHRTTPYFVRRFGTPFESRPASEKPPETLTLGETRYVEQLLDVYEERHGVSFTAETAVSDAKVSEHFRRQRESFYRAESLRRFARDAVPPGTFDLLQDDIWSGVVDVVEDQHPDGLSRLTKTLAHVGTLDLQQHTLIGVANIEDRKGICHQLANSDRIEWMRP